MKARKMIPLILMASIVSSDPGFAQNPFTEEEVEIKFSIDGTDSLIEEIDDISDEISDLITDSSNENEGSSSSSGDYLVVKGNTLSGIARKFLGDAGRWRDLVSWNLDRYPSLLKNPDLILVGWNLRLAPAKSEKADRQIVSDTPNTSETDETMSSSETNPAPSASVTGNENSSRSGGPLITPESRVLHIGDSHTCGIYGKAMDDLMRSTGAAITTVGVSGSSPSWYLNETVGKSGYFAKDEQSRIDQPADWRTPRSTPNLNKLIKDFKPGIIVFSLGANMIGASPEAIRSQVKSVCDIAKKAGCQIVWVGPPNGRADKKPTEKQNRLYENLKAEAEKYGSFIDSRPHTHYPDNGGDGVHFWGNEGSKIARDWAGKIFESMQKP
ncbi:MAG: hypothetical protein ACOYXC_09495 [Candidatus Rifleibacteriota bacterium]